MGERLQCCRNLLKLSQEELASKVEASRPAYAQWEVGLTQPRLERIAALAEVLGVSPAYLAFGDTSITQREPVPGVAWVDEMPLGQREPCKQWGIPSRYFEDLGASPERVRIVSMQHDDPEAGLRREDKLLLDVSSTEANPPGLYVYESDGRLAVGFLSLLPAPKNRSSVVIRVRDSAHCVPADRITVRGRVLAEWKRS
jgi:DNA-binding XRE family transcriptional regulator